MTREHRTIISGFALRATAVALAASVLVAVFVIRPVEAADPVTGAGSTFAKIAIDQWVRDVSGQGLRVNYQGPGSSQGRNLFKAGQVDFASSDIPFEQQEQPVSRPFTYLPLVAGGTALMYNLVDTAGRQIDNLELSGGTIAKIFTGQIRNWRAGEILADNPGIAAGIPDQDIKTVVRSGGSGTSAVFTGYMAAIDPGAWAAFAAQYGIPGNFTSTFPDVPGFIKQPGSSEIATFVSNPNAGRGSIGYAEAGYAHQASLPIAYVLNASGKWTLPTARNVAVALLEAQRNADGTQNLSNVYFNPRPEAYAISSYNYMIAPLDISESKGETLTRFITYSVTDGQSKAAPLGYSPLPPNLCDQALQEAARIPAPQAAKDEALGWIGQCGQQYLGLETQTPVDQPDPQGPGGGGGDDGGSGEANQAAANATGASPTDTAATTVEGGEDELASDLSTRLQTDASGKAVLSDAARAALDKSDAYTWALLLVGVAIVFAFFAPPLVGHMRGRRGRKGSS
jgi:phosphate transport system substrate-binding protein